MILEQYLPFTDTEVTTEDFPKKESSTATVPRESGMTADLATAQATTGGEVEGSTRTITDHRTGKYP